MDKKVKTASEVRNEAARIAKWAAEERERTGDPEGAEVIREIVRDIQSIKIRSSKP